MKFLSALWPDPDRAGDLTFWFTPGKLSHHIPVRSLPLGVDDYAELKEQADAEGWNVYFGLGLRREGLEPHQQGGKKDTIALPAFVLDIDFYNPNHPDAHKAKNLPPDFEAAAAVLFPPGTLDPSAIIGTGNGAQVYWLFNQPVELTSASKVTQVQKAYKAFQKVFIDRAKAVGWQLDLTATVQRVWRMPGFVNQKSGRPAEIWHLDADTRYEPEQLGIGVASTSADANASTAPTNADGTKTTKAAADLPDLCAALKGISKSNAYYDAIQKALAGESMAERGSRDEVLQGVCSTVAWLPEGREADPNELAEVLRESLQKWADEEDAARTIDEELQKAADKIERSQDDWRDQDAARRPQLDALARALGKRATSDSDDGEGGSGNDSNTFFEHHAIIQKRNTYYVFDFRSGRDRYSHPLTKEEVEGYLDKVWETGPIKLHFVSAADGSKKKKPLKFILERNREIATKIIGDLTLQTGRYDVAEETFYEALAPRRVTEALFDQNIDTWLRLLCGASYEKVCDWIAAVPQLQHQCCVLYLDGVSGSGKGLLANGLARLWTTGSPTPFANVLGDFNSDIIDCPLLLADEGIPTRKGDVSAELRALIGSSKLTINEKYLTPRKVNGSVRLIIAANNDEALMFGNENLSVNDLEAVVGRFLHVHACRAAAEWINANNVGGHLTRSWVDGDLIAKHCLALAEMRKINAGKRFLVEGDETHMHRKLLMQGAADGAVHEWLVRFATRPAVIASRYSAKNETPRAIIVGGKVLVNAQGVIDCWDAYMGDKTKCPSTRKVGHSLNKLAHRRVRRGPRGDRPWYHEIDPTLVVELSQEMQVGNEERILANVAEAGDDDGGDDGDIADDAGVADGQTGAVGGAGQDDSPGDSDAERSDNNETT